MSRNTILLLCLLALASTSLALFQAPHFEAIFQKYGCRKLHCYSIDGLGNNEHHKGWGAAHSNFRVEFHKAYLDHYEIPAHSHISPRTISNILMDQTGDLFNAKCLSGWAWNFAEFVHHDILDFSPKDYLDHFPIHVPKDDPVFQDYLPYDRYKGSSHAKKFLKEPRQHMNVETSFLDLSNIYGSSHHRSHALREHEGGLLKTSPSTYGPLLPYNYPGTKYGYSDGYHYNLGIGNNPDAFFLSGDPRVNEFTTLTALNTLFVREHNRLAAEIDLAATNSGCHLYDDDIFEIARSVNIAQYQYIVYNHWLPALLGKYSPSPEHAYYDKTLDPTVSSTFASVASKFTGSMMGGQYANFGLDDTFFNPDSLAVNGLCPAFSALDIPAQAVDTLYVPEVRNFYFNSVGMGTDLAALSIQQGRDLGALSYKELVKSLGYYPVYTFSDITENPTVTGKMSTAYHNALGEVDALVGVLAEDRLGDSVFGETLTTLYADQFYRLAVGDQCFYHTAWGKTELDGPVITSLGDLLAINSDCYPSGAGADLFYSKGSQCVPLPPLPEDEHTKRRYHPKSAIFRYDIYRPDYSPYGSQHHDDYKDSGYYHHDEYVGSGYGGSGYGGHSGGSKGQHYGKDPYAKDPYAQTYPSGGYGEPYAKDPYAKDPYAQTYPSGGYAEPYKPAPYGDFGYGGYGAGGGGYGYAFEDTTATPTTTKDTKAAKPAPKPFTARRK